MQEHPLSRAMGFERRVLLGSAHPRVRTVLGAANECFRVVHYNQEVRGIEAYRPFEGPFSLRPWSWPTCVLEYTGPIGRRCSQSRQNLSGRDLVG